MAIDVIGKIEIIAVDKYESALNATLDMAYVGTQENELADSFAKGSSNHTPYTMSELLAR